MKAVSTANSHPNAEFGEPKLLPDHRPLHKFNEIIARFFGIPSALLFEYFKFRCAKDGVQMEERNPETLQKTGKVITVYKFKQLSLGDLQRLYPYMGREEIRLGVWRLWSSDSDVGMAPLLSRVKVSGTDCYKYRVRDDVYDELYTYRRSDYELPALRDGALHRLHPKLAKEIGIVPAIIIENIRYHVLRNWERAAASVGDDFYKTLQRADHFISPHAWQESHRYISPSTAKRGFRLVEASGHIVKKGIRFGRIPIWTLADKELDDFAKSKMDGHPDYSQKRRVNALEDNDL